MMKRLKWMTSGGLSLASAALCCLTASAVRVETAYDHKEGSYYARQPVTFTVTVKDDAGAKVTQAQDGKGWLGSGSLPLSFTAAKARLGTAISAAGWAHLHTIELSKDRVLEAWSRRDEELTVMVWRIAAGRSGFSYGISKKAGAGKDAK